MARVSTFGFTNNTASSHTITPVAIGPVTNYAKIADEPTSCELQNKTAPLDQGELLSFKAQDVAKVTTTQVVQNPTSVRNGVQYVVKLEEILRTSDVSTGDIICDEPIVAYLTIRHQKSGNINATLIDQVVKRLIGACYKSDGSSRWDDLMRSALVPIVD